MPRWDLEIGSWLDWCQDGDGPYRRQMVRLMGETCYGQSDLVLKRSAGLSFH